MFTLRQPHADAGSPTKGEKGDGLPVVPMTEDSHTLELLLRICYPVADPDLTFGDIQPLARAVTKYAMDAVVGAVKHFLTASVRAAPLRVYVLAVRYQFEQETREAARMFLGSQTPTEYVPELEGLDAVAYQRLLH